MQNVFKGPKSLVCFMFLFLPWKKYSDTGVVTDLCVTGQALVTVLSYLEAELLQTDGLACLPARVLTVVGVPLTDKQEK